MSIYGINRRINSQLFEVMLQLIEIFVKKTAFFIIFYLHHAQNWHKLTLSLIIDIIRKKIESQ